MDTKLSGEHDEEEIFSATTEEYPAFQQITTVTTSNVESSTTLKTASRKVKYLIALAVFLVLSGIATAVGITMANRTSSVEEAAAVAAPAAGEDEVESGTSYLRPKEEQNVISEMNYGSKSAKPAHTSATSANIESTKSAKEEEEEESTVLIIGSMSSMSMPANIVQQGEDGPQFERRQYN